MAKVGRSLIVYLRDLGDIPSSSAAIARVIDVELRNTGTAEDPRYFGWGSGLISTVSLERKAESVCFEYHEPAPALRLCFTVRSYAIEHELDAQVEPMVFHWLRQLPKEWSVRVVGWAEESPMRVGKSLHVVFPTEKDVAKLARRVASLLGIRLFEDVSGHFEEFPAFVGTSDELGFNLLGPARDLDKDEQEGACCSLEVVIDEAVTKWDDELEIQRFVVMHLSLDPDLSFDVAGWSN